MEHQKRAKEAENLDNGALGNIRKQSKHKFERGSCKLKSNFLEFRWWIIVVR